MPPSSSAIFQPFKRCSGSRSEKQPFEPGALETEWVSVNPDLGELRGRATVVGDSLLFEYASEDREHSGTEYLRRLDDDRYENPPRTHAAAWHPRLEFRRTVA